MDNVNELLESSAKTPKNSYFLKSNGTLVPVSGTAIVSKLDPAFYYAQDTMTGPILVEADIDEFAMPKKIYGSTTKDSGRILNTFKNRTGKNTGVLMSGIKGSGKSILAKKVCADALAQDLPVVMVNSCMSGNSLTALLGAVTQPLVIFIDEFEKIYKDEDAKNTLLSFLDGTGANQFLLLLTANEKRGISQYLLNRPGRVYYHLKFNGLAEEFIHEYCEDNIQDRDRLKELTQELVLLSNAVTITMDILTALVDELNLYGGTVREHLKILNVETEAISRLYKGTIFKDGKEIHEEMCWYTLGEEEVGTFWLNEDDDDEKETTLEFKAEHLVDIQASGKNLTFENDEYVLHLIEPGKVETMDRLYNLPTQARGLSQELSF